MPQLMFGLILGGAVLFFTWKIVLTIRRQRAFGRLELSRIGDLTPGFVHVAGQVRRSAAGTTIVSPCSGEPCVYYELTVERERYVDDGPTWASLWSKKESSTFSLQDQSGQVRIRPQAMDLIMREQSCITLAGHEAPPEPLATCLSRLGRSLDTNSDKKQVSEKRLTEGQHLKVFGYATRARGPLASASFTIGKRFGWPLYVAEDEASLKDEFESSILMHALGLVVTIIAIVIVVLNRRVIF